MLTTDFLEITNAVCPDRPAIIFEGRNISYGELHQRVQRLATGLAALGVQPGDTVALLQVNTPQCIETYFAAAILGAIYVPLNFRARAQELEYLITTADTKVLLVGDRYLTQVDDLRPRLGAVSHLVALDAAANGWLQYERLVQDHQPEPPFVDQPEDATTILMYTAGTAGFPKAVMLHHTSFTSYVLNNVEPVDLDTEERNLLTVPLYHIAGIQAVMAAVYGGRTLVMQRQFDAGEWLELVERERVQRAMMVPTMLKQIMEHLQFGRRDLSSLRVITYGAAPMPIEVLLRALEAFPGCQFINAFGQTETAATITALNPEDHVIPPSLGEPERSRRIKRLSSVGRPLADVEMRVVDEHGNPVPPNTEGEIVARGPRVMAGYWKDEERTSRAKRDGWIYTGDLGYVDDDGYYFLAGRASDLIIRGGENIAPEEVEAAIGSHPAVDECAVFGLPDLHWGEVVAAAVVLKPGMQASADDIVECCRQRLASFKKPERVFFTGELPRNPLGKVLRRELQDQHASSDKLRTSG